MALVVPLAATIMVSDLGARVGSDYRLYVEAADRWLSGNGFYFEWQMRGPYDLGGSPILYPPYALALFAPFTFLPSVLWWLPPLTIIAMTIAHHRPRPWSWPLLAVAFGYVNSFWLVWSGNPVIWATAAVSLATTWRWPAVFVLIKPSLAPFALLGVATRGWWIGAAGLVAVSVALAPLWQDYVVALGNFSTGRGVFYSLGDVPLMLAPLIAKAGTARSSSNR